LKVRPRGILLGLRPVNRQGGFRQERSIVDDGGGFIEHCDQSPARFLDANFSEKSNVAFGVDYGFYRLDHPCLHDDFSMTSGS
jgi:hypothetical protein